MKKNNLLTTGAFARLCNITKHTLFHYEDIGIFLPAYTDEKGYRYYDILQYDTFCTIAQLKLTGMSLKEIEGYLENRSPRKMIELFTDQTAVIDKKIKELQQIKQNLNYLCRSAEKALSTENPVFIAREPEAVLVLSAPMQEADDYKMTSVFGNLVTSVRENGYIFPSGMIRRIQDLKIGEEKKHYHFYVHGLSHDNNATMIKPEGDYLVTYHTGGYEKLRDTHKKIFTYAEENHLTLDKWIFEEIVIGDYGVSRPEEYVLKLAVKVNK